MNAYLVKTMSSPNTRLLDNASAVEEVIANARRQVNALVSLEESWCGLHFVLTGEVPTPKDQALKMGISWDDESLENVLMGGEPTPYKDSFSVARCLAPDHVARLNGKLSTISNEKFSSWFDPEALIENKIPPEIWERDPDALPWLLDHFNKLKRFYQNAANERVGILIYIDDF